MIGPHSAYVELVAVVPRLAVGAAALKVLALDARRGSVDARAHESNAPARVRHAGGVPPRLHCHAQRHVLRERAERTTIDESIGGDADGGAGQAAAGSARATAKYAPRGAPGAGGAAVHVDPRARAHTRVRLTIRNRRRAQRAGQPAARARVGDGRGKVAPSTRHARVGTRRPRQLLDHLDLCLAPPIRAGRRAGTLHPVQ